MSYTLRENTARKRNQGRWNEYNENNVGKTYLTTPRKRAFRYRKHAGGNLFRRYENYEMCFKCHTMMRILVRNSEHEEESLG